MDSHSNPANERVTLNGVSCVIEIVQFSNGFGAKWVCERCGQSGQSAAKYSRGKSAIEWARLACQSHLGSHVR